MEIIYALLCSVMHAGLIQVRVGSVVAFSAFEIHKSRMFVYHKFRKFLPSSEAPYALQAQMKRLLLTRYSAQCVIHINYFSAVGVTPQVIKNLITAPLNSHW